MKRDRSKGETPTIYNCRPQTEFSDDSNISISLQIEKVTKLGMKEICITDHRGYDFGLCGYDFILDIPAYLMALHMPRTDYRDHIRINIGIEPGLQEHLKQYLEHSVKCYGDSFDFVIGSSRLVKNMDPYNPGYWNNQDGMANFEDFFETLLVRVRGLCHTFDFFGHLDYMVRYAPHQNDSHNCRRPNRWIDPLLEILIENGKPPECNIGGFKYGLGQPGPCRKTLMCCRELSGEMIIIGFDVHTPEYVGYAFDICRKPLLGCSYKYFIMYHGRKLESIPFQPGNG